MTNNDHLDASSSAAARSKHRGARWILLPLLFGAMAAQAQACSGGGGRRAEQAPGAGGTQTDGGAGGESNGDGDGDMTGGRGGDGDGDMPEMCAPAGETGPCANMACPFANQECIALDDTQATCQCRSGYGGAECTDINECDLGSPCGDTAACVNFDGGFRCDCLPGFAGNNCNNIDECDEGVDACDAANGQCSDTDGAYDCACGGGQSGDGFLCQAANECAGACDGNTCDAIPGGHVCSCPLGTTGADCGDTTTCSPTTVLNEDVDPVIEDEVLRNYLHAVTGIAPGDDITVADLAALPSQSLVMSAPFSPGDPVVSTLEGIQCWTTLENVELNGQDVTDLSPLADLGSLTELSLGCSAATSLDGIEKLINLEALRVDSWSATFDDGMNMFTVGCDRPERLTDISAIAELHNLRILDLGGHGLTDLNQLQDLRRLEMLNLRNNALSDLSDLSGLVSLQQLDVSDNNLTALDGLSGLPALAVINASDNAITDVSGLEDASGPVLMLDLQNNKVRNIDALASLTNLRELILADNPKLDDAETLATLVLLTELNVSNTSISSLAPFADEADYGQDGGRLLAAGTNFVCEEEQEYIDELVSRGVTVFADVVSE